MSVNLVLKEVFTSVSYTHLDVYKRQELYVKNGAELILNEGNTLVFYDKFDDVINTSTTKYPDRPASVSYTHLDVYKRQHQ